METLKRKKDKKSKSKKEGSVQSILIDKNMFTLTEAQDWIIEHGYKIKKVDITEGKYRFRQKEPSLFNNFTTHKLMDGVSMIYGWYLPEQII